MRQPRATKEFELLAELRRWKLKEREKGWEQR